MIKNIFFIFSAFVAVQCQMYSAPYQKSCSCGMPAMPAILPANPPCGNPMSFSLPVYEMALPAAKAKMPFLAAPYELPISIAKGPLLSAPYEMPLPVALPVPAPMPQIMAKPPCGCFDVPAPQFELPAGLPLPNPFLPAASPVSAIAPFNPLLPPACPCSRCQYLKKIPIPPPCI